jgi:hypothetical protein
MSLRAGEAFAGAKVAENSQKHAANGVNDHPLAPAVSVFEDYDFEIA